MEGSEKMSKWDRVLATHGKSYEQLYKDNESGLERATQAESKQRAKRKAMSKIMSMCDGLSGQAEQACLLKQSQALESLEYDFE